jgi:hypothetical protein
VVEFAAYRGEARLNIAQALSISELSEGHCQELVPTGKALLLMIAVIPAYTLLKLVTGKIVHELRENSLAKIHSSLSVFSFRRQRGAKTTNVSDFTPENFQIEKS